MVWVSPAPTFSSAADVSTSTFFVPAAVENLPARNQQLINDHQEARAAQNLLLNTGQPVLQVFIDVGLNIVLRHRRLFDQNQRARLIACRQNPAGSPDHKPPKKQWYEEVNMPAPDHIQVALDVGPLGTSFLGDF